MTPRVRAAIRRRVKAAPTKSLRKISRESGVGRESVRKVVVEAGWKSLRRVKVPLISAEGCERRASRAAGLINALKLLPRNHIIFFSDEKNFAVDPVYNPQNDRWIRFGGGGGGEGGGGGGEGGGGGGEGGGRGGGGDAVGKFIGRSSILPPSCSLESWLALERLSRQFGSNPAFVWARRST